MTSSTEAEAASDAPLTRSARRRIATERFTAVDGARGIAILSVLLYHTGWSSRGLFGVDVFFVISGFLITFLLSSEIASTGRIRFGRFYGRRAKRLLPGLAVTLTGVLLTLWWAGSLEELQEAARTAIASVLQVANWQQLDANIAYRQETGALVPLGQMWSLSATEQFYVVWPLAVATLWWACRRRAGLFASVLLVLVAVSALVAPLLFDGSNQERLYLGTDSRAVAFVAGAAAAAGVAWLRARRVSWAVGAPSARARGLVTTVSLLALSGVVAASVLTKTYQDPWLYRGGLAVVAACAALFVATLALRGNALARPFSWRPFVAVGVVSYSMFLLHLPVFWIVQSLANGQLPPLVLFLVGGVLTWLAAVVLHYVVTEPLRVKKWRATSASVTIAIALACVLSAAFLLPAERAGHPQSHLAALEESRPKSGFGGQETDDPPETPFVLRDATRLDAAAGGPLRIAVIGDSVAKNMFDALDHYGSPAVMAINAAAGGCGIIDAEQARSGQGYLMESRKLCWHWKSDLRAADAERPLDAIVVHNLWDVNDQLIDGAWVGPCTPQWQQRYAAQLEALAAIGEDSPGPAPTILLSNDHSRDPDGPLNTERLACKDRVADALAARHPRVHVLDLEAAVCPTGTCLETDAQGRAIYRDGSHFNETGMSLLAPWLENELAHARMAEKRNT